MIEHLTDGNFKNIALEHYENLRCFSSSEFEMDLRRFAYIANLLSKYGKTNFITERLIINNVIVVFNLFGAFALDGLLFKTKDVKSRIILASLFTAIGYDMTKFKNLEPDQALVEVFRKEFYKK